VLQLLEVDSLDQLPETDWQPDAEGGTDQVVDLTQHLDQERVNVYLQMTG
jgi:hypothetical protein